MSEVAVTETFEIAPSIADQDALLRAQIANLNNPGQSVASSFPITDGNMLRVFELIGSAEPLEEHCEEPFELTHYVAQIVSFTDDQGFLQRGIRLVLVTKDLKGYATMSDVVRADLETLVGLIGEPQSWKAPVLVQAVKEKSNKKREFMTLRCVIK